MSENNGRNPLRYNCTKEGCFNIKKHPKLEIFAQCFPGKIAMTDIDGSVEVKGNILHLEWKTHTNIGIGQRLYFERTTALAPCHTFFVVGNAETMVVKQMCIIHKGRIGKWFNTDLKGLLKQFRKWKDYAIDNSLITPDGKVATWAMWENRLNKSTPLPADRSGGVQHNQTKHNQTQYSRCSPKGNKGCFFSFE